MLNSYVKVSDNKQVKGESLDGQEKACRKFAEKNGYIIVRNYREEGETARTKNNRDELTKMMASATSKKNNIKAIICYHSSRFARNVNDGSSLETILEKSGIQVLYVEGNNEQSANGKFVRNIGKAYDQYESDINSERTKLGMKEAVSKGRWL
ncbi:MAG: recombinase family protein [Endomicrobium sp.]|jgi:site-specific DNA recombinase|nr:recombinase family protein [Endomicrobium sp.]